MPWTCHGNLTPAIFAQSSWREKLACLRRCQQDDPFPVGQRSHARADRWFSDHHNETHPLGEEKQNRDHADRRPAPDNVEATSSSRQEIRSSFNSSSDNIAPTHGHHGVLSGQQQGRSSRDAFLINFSAPASETIDGSGGAADAPPIPNATGRGARRAHPSNASGVGTGGSPDMPPHQHQSMHTGGPDHGRVVPMSAPPARDVGAIAAENSAASAVKAARSGALSSNRRKPKMRRLAEANKKAGGRPLARKRKGAAGSASRHPRAFKRNRRRPRADKENGEPMEFSRSPPRRPRRPRRHPRSQKFSKVGDGGAVPARRPRSRAERQNGGTDADGAVRRHPRGRAKRRLREFAVSDEDTDAEIDVGRRRHAQKRRRLHPKTDRSVGYRTTDAAELVSAGAFDHVDAAEDFDLLPDTPPARSATGDGGATRRLTSRPSARGGVPRHANDATANDGTGRPRSSKSTAGGASAPSTKRPRPRNPTSPMSVSVNRASRTLSHALRSPRSPSTNRSSHSSQPLVPRNLSSRSTSSGSRAPLRGTFVASTSSSSCAASLSSSSTSVSDVVGGFLPSSSSLSPPSGCTPAAPTSSSSHDASSSTTSTSVSDGKGSSTPSSSSSSAAAARRSRRLANEQLAAEGFLLLVEKLRQQKSLKGKNHVTLADSKAPLGNESAPSENENVPSLSHVSTAESSSTGVSTTEPRSRGSHPRSFSPPLPVSREMRRSKPTNPSLSVPSPAVILPPASPPRPSVILPSFPEAPNCAESVPTSSSSSPPAAHVEARLLKPTTRSSGSRNTAQSVGTPPPPPTARVETRLQPTNRSSSSRGAFDSAETSPPPPPPPTTRVDARLPKPASRSSSSRNKSPSADTPPPPPTARVKTWLPPMNRSSSSRSTVDSAETSPPPPPRPMTRVETRLPIPTNRSSSCHNTPQSAEMPPPPPPPPAAHVKTRLPKPAKRSSSSHNTPQSAEMPPPPPPPPRGAPTSEESPQNLAVVKREMLPNAALPAASGRMSHHVGASGSVVAARAGIPAHVLVDEPSTFQRWLEIHDNSQATSSSSTNVAPAPVPGTDENTVASSLAPNVSSNSAAASIAPRGTAPNPATTSIAPRGAAPNPAAAPSAPRGAAPNLAAASIAPGGAAPSPAPTLPRMSDTAWRRLARCLPSNTKKVDLKLPRVIPTWTLLKALTREKGVFSMKCGKCRKEQRVTIDSRLEPRVECCACEARNWMNWAKIEDLTRGKY